MLSTAGLELFGAEVMLLVAGLCLSLLLLCPGPVSLVLLAAGWVLLDVSLVVLSADLELLVAGLVLSAAALVL